MHFDHLLAQKGVIYAVKNENPKQMHEERNNFANAKDVVQEQIENKSEYLLNQLTVEQNEVFQSIYKSNVYGQYILQNIR